MFQDLPDSLLAGTRAKAQSPAVGKRLVHRRYESQQFSTDEPIGPPLDVKVEDGE